MTFPQARALVDMHMCFTPAPPPAPPVPVPVPIPLMGPGAPTVLVGNFPACRMTVDQCNPAFPHPILKGSATVIIMNFPAARVMDNCACGGMISVGFPQVIVGG